jgi:4a-hydroxytetrahydrobiopterin dehydratase
MDLTKKHCVPCEGNIPPLDAATVAAYAGNIPGWKIADNKKLVREFRFKDFKMAMAFVNRVAEIAESEQHHPDISVSYNLVHLKLTTHAIHDLSENDFIVAAKVDALC